jgi:anti-sigma factor RsiW
MNCRDIEPLLLAERDSVLTNDQHASLERHVAACPACQQLRARLREAIEAFRTDAANIPVPDAEAEWHTLRAQLHGERAKPAKTRPLAPVIWFGSSLAAAAALAFVYFGASSQPTPAVTSPQPTPAVTAAPQIAQAEFVEAGDSAASTIVYVDKDSGWLVVWAANTAPKTSG